MDLEAILRRLERAEARCGQLEAEAVVARRQAEAAGASLAERTRFFAQTSHELRTPLNAIIGFAELIRSQMFGPVSERYIEYAQLIKEGGDNLQIVVDDVTDLARIEAGRYEIHAETVSLTELAEEAVRFMTEMAARKKVKLEFSNLANADVEAMADMRAVRQIALNLVSNALKFTPPGGSVEVTVREAPRGSILVVSDTGVGISPEELERLSRAFEQGEAGRREKGSGLGLSVVRAFVDLHGGRLTIESQPGGGTSVAVHFPHAPPAG